jgi:prepilin-type N-terminal cleavage/methylation domain-containing protein
MRATYPRRGGFTLVELLVAVGIILVLAGLALLVANSGIVGNVRTSSGSDRIGGWLMQAREKAKRDNAPRGIRFLVGAGGFVREAELIEVPEPYVMPAGYVLMIENSPSRHIYIVPTAGGNALTELTANVAIGDTLSIPSTGTIHRIQTIQAATVTIGGNPVAAAEIVPVQSPLIPDLAAAASPVVLTPTYSTPKFGFIRQPRPTFGEPPLLLPDTVVIDPALCQITPNPITGGTLDVIFGPNGEVYNAGGLGRVVLWTRNPEAFAGNPVTANGGGDRPSYEQAGEMRLIVVYTKTGAVAVQPPALPPGPGPNPGFDPYTTTRDGIASGL